MSEHNKIFRSYVRSIILEDDGGGGDGDGGDGGGWGGGFYGGGGGGYGYGGYGSYGGPYSYSSSKKGRRRGRRGGRRGYGGYGGMGMGVSPQFFTDLWNSFIDPLKHAAAFVEKFSSKLQKIAGTLAEDVMSIALPGYQTNYEQYEEEYQEREEAIREKYADVLSRTESHLFTGDAALMSFLYAPYAYITGRVVQQTPEAAVSMIDMLAGGNPDVAEFTDKIRDYTERFKQYGRMRGGPTSPSPEPIEMDESNKKINEQFLLNELKILEKIKNFLTGNKKIEQAVEKSPIVKQMEKDAEQYVKDWVQGFVNMTSESLKLEDTEKLNKMTKGKFEKIANKAGSKKEAQNVAKLAIKGTEKSIKKMAKDIISNKIKQLPGGKSNPLAQVYQQGYEAISKLK